MQPCAAPFDLAARGAAQRLCWYLGVPPARFERAAGGLEVRELQSQSQEMPGNACGAGALRGISTRCYATLFAPRIMEISPSINALATRSTAASRVFIPKST
jgi:hypothetical protein